MPEHRDIGPHRRIIRVFPRRTAATPTYQSARVGLPGLFDEADEIHISVCFTWDLQAAESLAKQWRPVAPVKIGGPATGEAGGDFTPGQYLKTGYVITSRGCPNNCWFCDVWKREGRSIRELPIRDGWNVLDDNLLATSPGHFDAVVGMLHRMKQDGHQIEFTGGLDASLLTDYHVNRLRELRPKQLFFAYDTPDDIEPLREAGRKLLGAGWTTASHRLRAYVLIGHKGDTISAAETRLLETMDAGFLPMAMLYRPRIIREILPEWRKFQRRWSRPAIMRAIAHGRQPGLFDKEDA